MSTAGVRKVYGMFSGVTIFSGEGINVGIHSEFLMVEYVPGNRSDIGRRGCRGPGFVVLLPGWLSQTCKCVVSDFRWKFFW